jgi:hypothetical protein
VRKLIAAGLAAGLTLLMAPAASATTRDLNDDAGDVMTATVDSQGKITQYNREGGAEGDITFARIQHTATAVVVYMRYRQLSVPKQYGGFSYTIEGNNDQAALVDIETRHGKPQGDAEVFSTGRRCGLSWHINYAGDSISMRIPRSCVHRAKYVRLTHISFEARQRPDGSGKIYYDNPARNGGTVNQVSNTPTPWVVTG